jgi:hypothetical protein
MYNLEDERVFVPAEKDCRVTMNMERKLLPVMTQAQNRIERKELQAMTEVRHAGTRGGGCQAEQSARDPPLLVLPGRPLS